MNDAPGRILVVMRHAQAEPYAESDRHRPLTDRGRSDAAAAGRHLADRHLVPSHALVSSATRAVETWQQVRDATGAEATEEVLDALYGATPTTVIELLRLVPATAEVALFVGHNPCVGALVHMLDDHEGDPALLSGMLGGFPTGAVAVFQVSDGWDGVDEGSVRLVDFHVGRG